MTSGGARTRSGPAPDKDALRRERDGGEWTPIAAEQREDPAPEWPLSKPFTAREKVVWAREWRRPQARMWERLGLEELVAQYVRTFCRYEKRDSRTGDGTLMIRLAEDLGISTTGLAKNHWIIGTATPAGAAALEATRGNDGPSVKDRLKLVSGGSAS